MLVEENNFDDEEIVCETKIPPFDLTRRHMYELE